MPFTVEWILTPHLEDKWNKLAAHPGFSHIFNFLEPLKIRNGFYRGQSIAFFSVKRQENILGKVEEIAKWLMWSKICRIWRSICVSVFRNSELWTQFESRRFLALLANANGNRHKHTFLKILTSTVVESWHCEWCWNNNGLAIRRDCCTQLFC